MWASPAPSSAPSTRRAVAVAAGQHDRARVLAASAGISAPGAEAGPADEHRRAAVRRPAGRARSQARADGATLTARSRSAGSSAHGTACSRPGGTTTTGPSPRCRRGRAEQHRLQPAPAGLQRGQRRPPGPRPGRVRSRRRLNRAQLDLARAAVVGPAGRDVPDPARAARPACAGRRRSSTICDQPVVAERAEEFPGAEPVPGARAAARPAGGRAAPWPARPLPAAAARAGACAAGSPPARARSRRLVTSRSAARSACELCVVGRAGRGDGASAVARQRSLQASSSRGRPDLQRGPLRRAPRVRPRARWPGPAVPRRPA